MGRPGSSRDERPRALRAASRLFADERIRFAFVGAFNTVFGYAIFVLLQLIGGASPNYFVSLYGSYCVSTTVAFFLHRHFTYRRGKSGRVLVDFMRFQGVYALAVAVNTVALPLLVEVGDVRPLLAQAGIVVVTTAISYFGHKYFSFRRTPRSVG